MAAFMTRPMPLTPRRLETVVEFILASLREDENNEDIPGGGLVSSFLLDK